MVEKVSWDVLVAALFDVINLEHGEQPEEYARNNNENRPLEAWR